MDFDENLDDFFGEEELFGGDGDEAIEDNRFDADGKMVKKKGKTDEVSDFLKSEKKAIVHRKVNPRALLNEKTLLRPDIGIRALKEEFSTFKPDPKKDPYRNLKGLLHRTQHWAHVLAPRLKFEDAIARCEQLGEKRVVRLYMQKIRLGMNLEDEDFEAEKAKGQKKRKGVDENGLITTEYRSDDDEGEDYGRKSGSEGAEDQADDNPTVQEQYERYVNQPPRSLFGGAPIPSRPYDPPSPPPSSARSLFAKKPQGLEALASTTVAEPPKQISLTEEERRIVAEKRMRALELRAKREQEQREREQQREATVTPDTVVPNTVIPDTVPQDQPMDQYEMDEDEIMAQFDDFE